MKMNKDIIEQKIQCIIFLLYLRVPGLKLQEDLHQPQLLSADIPFTPGPCSNCIKLHITNH